MKFLILLLPAVALWTSAQLSGEEPRAVATTPAVSRRPVPSQDQLAKAEIALKDLFKEDLKKNDAGDQIALAERLILYAASPATEDPAMRYSALQMALDISSK